MDVRVIEGFEPTDMTAAPPRTSEQGDHFAPSDHTRLLEALPELEKIPGISREWVEWYEGLTARMGVATGVVVPEVVHSAREASDG